MRIPVPDRPGVLAEVTTLASELDVNIHDLEIAHSAEGDRGVVVIVIDAASADLLRGGLWHAATGRQPAHSREHFAGPPPARLRGTLRVPGDKSISHRALLLAALAEGTSTVRGLSTGDDVRRTRVAVEAMGAVVEGERVHGGATILRPAR